MTLPIYYTYKTAKGIKTVLVGMNEYEHMHHIVRNNMKRYFYSLIRSKLAKVKLKGKVKTHYTIYYKNPRCDGGNIVAAIDKMFMDELQNSKVIKDDNVTEYIGSSWEVAHQDKENPRVEVKLFEVD